MDLDKIFEKLISETENIVLIEAYAALKKQTVNAMNDAIKAIDILEHALEKAEQRASNSNTLCGDTTFECNHRKKNYCYSLDECSLKFY